MSLEDDEYIFIESKARELVYFLLKNDIIIYRKLIPEIKRLDSEHLKICLKESHLKAQIIKMDIIIMLKIKEILKN